MERSRYIRIPFKAAGLRDFLRNPEVIARPGQRNTDRSLLRLARTAPAVVLCGLMLALAGCGSSVKLAPDTGVFLVTPTTAAFGSVSVGQKASMNISLVNKTLSSVQIAQIDLSGSEFAFVNAPTLPVTVASGATYTIAVQFAPTVIGAATGQVTVATAADTASPTVVDLSGTGAAATTGALSSLTCTTTAFTGAGTDNCTVTLSSAAGTNGVVVSLASNNSAVTVPSSVTVNAQATAATFTATVASVTASQNAKITATSGNSTASFTLQLGPPAALLSVDATAVAFGDVLVNSPATQTVTMTSSGSLPVTVNSATLTGSSFLLSGATLPATLNPGQTATLNVQFDPTTTGAASGTLTIVSTSASNPTVTLALSGTGVVGTVSLTWDAPTTSIDPVATYNVYRGVSGSSTYQLIGSTTLSQTSYTDSAAATGTEYNYYVTSVDASGVESVPSNTATVDIPQ